MYQKTSQGESSSPWPDSLRTVPRDGFPNQSGCPREGLQAVFISQDDCKKGGPPQIPSPSSPQRVAEPLHLSGLQLEGQRCAPSFFGIVPRRIRCQLEFPVVRELVIKCTNNADRGVPTSG